MRSGGTILVCTVRSESLRRHSRLVFKASVRIEWASHGGESLGSLWRAAILPDLGCFFPISDVLFVGGAMIASLPFMAT